MIQREPSPFPVGRPYVAALPRRGISPLPGRPHRAAPTADFDEFLQRLAPQRHHRPEEPGGAAQEDQRGHLRAGSGSRSARSGREERCPARGRGGDGRRPQSAPLATSPPSRPLQQALGVEGTADEELGGPHQAHDGDLLAVQVGGQPDDAGDGEDRRAQEARHQGEPHARTTATTVSSCPSHSRSSSTSETSGRWRQPSSQARARARRRRSGSSPISSEAGSGSSSQPATRSDEAGEDLLEALAGPPRPSPARPTATPGAARGLGGQPAQRRLGRLRPQVDHHPHLPPPALDRGREVARSPAGRRRRRTGSPRS